MPQHNHFRLKLLVFLAALLAGAWFYSPGSWNAAARYDSIYALAEEGTFAIDTYITNPKKNVNTGDWSRHDGHYYSSKAPGNMFIGAAAYAPFYWGGRLLGVKHNVHLDLFYGWWINFWCSAVPLALGALCMLLLLLDWGFSPVRSTFWALCFALATPLFPYCTQLWGHPMAAAFLAVAFYASWKAKPSHVLAGFAVGWAVLADYAAAFALPALALPLLRAKDWRGTLKTALGGVLPLALFLWYHWVCFGSPVTIGNAYANPVFLQSEGAGGMMTRFSTLTFWKLLFGTQRGLIWNAPLLILAFPGAAALWRRNRWLAAGLAFTILAGCLSNSAYGYWDSGASVTARFLIYTLPAWIIFAAHWQPRTAPRQILALLLALWSFLNMFTVANISPTISTKRYSPLIPDAYWMCYRDGAWNRARSRGLKLYYWQKETKKISREAALSPGRLLFGHTPWSDIILFSGVAALLYFTLLRRELNAAARLKQWGREVREILQRNRHHLRSPWLYVTAAGALLLIIFPGASPWGTLQHNLVVEPMQALLLEKWADADNFATGFYQVLLSWQPNPLVIMILQGILAAALTIMGASGIAGALQLPRTKAAALALAFPIWTFCSRTICTTPLLIPLLLLAAAEAMKLLTQREAENPWKGLLRCFIPAALAFWQAPGTWPILLAAPAVILTSAELRRRHRLPLAIISLATAPAAIFHFLRYAQNPPDHVFGLEMLAVTGNDDFRNILALVLGGSALLGAASMFALKNPRRRPHILLMLGLLAADLIALFCSGGRVLSGHAVALFTAAGFPLVLIAASRFTPVLTLCTLLPICLSAGIIFRTHSRSAVDAPSLGEQWKVATEIVRLDGAGHDVSIKYHTSGKFLNTDTFEYLMELAYIVAPYSEVISPRPSRGPLRAEIKKEPETSRLLLEIHDPLTELFSR